MDGWRRDNVETKIKVAWLEDGDQSTRYFHAKASQRRKKNSITKLLDDQGCWKEGEECNLLIINYFSDLFATNGSRNQVAVLSNMESRITTDMNNELAQPFTAVEVS